MTPAQRRDYVRAALATKFDPRLVAEMRALVRDMLKGDLDEDERDVAVVVAAALANPPTVFVWKAVTDGVIRDYLPVDLTDEEVRRGRRLFAAWMTRGTESI